MRVRRGKAEGAAAANPPSRYAPVSGVAQGLVFFVLHPGAGEGGNAALRPLLH